MDARSPTEANGLILVRLIDIPVEKRRRVADRVIRVQGLVGVPAIDLKIAAEQPREGLYRLVAPDVASRVLGAR